MFVDLFFKVFHLGLFAYIGYYLYKKYYQHELNIQIENENNKANVLIEEHVHAEKILGQLAQQLVEQDQLCDVMMQKVKAWKSTIDLEVENRILRRNFLVEKIKEKRIHQFEYYYIEQAEKEILPTVVDEVEKELLKKYKSQASQDKYLAGILQFVKANKYERN